MSVSPVEFPDLPTLAHGLNAALESHGSSRGPVTILAREPNPRRSTYPSEVVDCRLADGSEVRLLCKYAAERGHSAHGHRGGVPYEAEVYRHVLQRLPVSAPMFYGLQGDGDTGRTWFAIEYIDRSVQAKDPPYREPMYAAAGWLGRFHRANESALSPSALPFLHRHDARYYLGWSERTAQLSGPLHQRFPWLATLCRRFEEVVDDLLEPPAIIIHGEYYPKNILFRDGTVYPIDWESTAVGIGAIDLASLIERWPAAVVERCEAEYLSARWPDGPPADFAQRLDLAKLYWRFRWLGERPDWTREEKSRWRFGELRVIGERLGLI